MGALTTMLVDVISRKSEWDSVIDQIGDHDFVHTFDFHQASQENGEGLPLMFVARDSQKSPKAIWPVLRRDITGTGFFDFTSVYGYSGPLFSTDSDCKLALNSIFNSMSKYGAISLFSRMHPLFVNKIPDDSLKGQLLSDVVVIDTIKTDDVLKGYRGSHRREIVKLSALGASITPDFDLDHLDDFVDIYRQSMTDLQASEYYYFSDSYFESIKKSKDFKTILIFAKLDGKNIASSMFIITGKVMQYYLSGTVAEFRKIAPSKAIIAHAHKIAIDLGVEFLILGGGVGSARDALFKFKSGFSTLTKPFYITKKILNQPVYSRLCAEKSINDDRTSFFPAYRA